MGVAVAVGEQFFKAFPERAYATTLVPAMLKDNRLGELLRFHPNSWRFSKKSQISSFFSYFLVYLSNHRALLLMKTGEKNGKGFYVYDSKRKAQPSPDVNSYLEASRKSAGLIKNGKVSFSPESFSHLPFCSLFQ